MALCQFLPGPASSQMLIAIGMRRAGLLGGLIAWLGFTLPSAVALVLFAVGLEQFDVSDAGWLHGLKIVAVAVVANAVWGMARTLAPDRPRATIAILAAIVVVASRTPLVQLLVIVAAGVVGWRLLSAGRERAAAGPLGVPFGRPAAIVALAVFFALLVGLPLASQLVTSPTLELVDSFYRVGSLVFGGGHVVLPLIEAEVVPPGWLTAERFIAGYGAAQAVPGPLFSFAAYLGAAREPAPAGVAGAALALTAIYVPSFLLLVGTLPLWEALRERAAFRSALLGVNAAVVGLLGAALYDPVWTSAITEASDFALALAALGLLAIWRLPPWAVVAMTAAGGQAVSML